MNVSSSLTSADVIDVCVCAVSQPFNLRDNKFTVGSWFFIWNKSIVRERILSRKIYGYVIFFQVEVMDQIELNVQLLMIT